MERVLQLAENPLFSSLSEDERAEISALFSVSHFLPGQPIIDCGGDAESFFVIAEGYVKVYRVGINGKQTVFAILGPGDFFGEMALFQEISRTAWVDSLTKGTVYVLAKSHFHRLLMTRPILAWKCLGVLSRRIVELEEQLDDLISLNVEERLKKVLANLSKDRGSDGLTFTHQELSELVGSSRETVTRVLGHLQQNGEIETGEQGIIFRPFLENAK